MAPPSPQQTSAGPDSDAIQGDGDYWFDDGNLVLIAKNHDAAARCKAFRIHIGVLARHSQAFKDLFSGKLPQPAAADEVDTTLDAGCPGVRMSDSYHDIKALLRALYDTLIYRRTSRSSPEEPLPFSEAAALVRLGHKYDIGPLLDLGLKSLSATFSTKAVWGWHAAAQKSLATPVRSLSKECVEAANLFRITGHRRLLVTALYACSAIDKKSLTSGVLRADGTLEVLSPDDLERCWELRACMDARLTDYIMDTLTLPSRQDCQQAKVCNKCVRQARPLRVCHRTPVQHKALHGGFGPVFPDWTKNLSLCSLCRAFYAKRELSFRRELWHTLPTMLGLPISDWHDNP
ncbi:hypothetical protein GY45DRAFT_1295053 [Cubamyces sp. BRFM 1775]|nr:hypothetical protein GY45DRAFT_1295053 [Cubamyces sp. BRFM 1775]